MDVHLVLKVSLQQKNLASLSLLECLVLKGIYAMTDFGNLASPVCPLVLDHIWRGQPLNDVCFFHVSQGVQRMSCAKFENEFRGPTLSSKAYISVKSL